MIKMCARCAKRPAYWLPSADAKPVFTGTRYCPRCTSELRKQRLVDPRKN